MMLGWEAEQVQICTRVEKSLLAMPRYREQLLILVLKKSVDKDVPTDY